MRVRWRVVTAAVATAAVLGGAVGVGVMLGRGELGMEEESADAASPAPVEVTEDVAPPSEPAQEPTDAAPETGTAPRWHPTPSPEPPQQPQTVADIAPGLQCRDLLADGFPVEDAVGYWRREGAPLRMDENGNGIPCETIYDTDAILAALGPAAPEPVGETIGADCPPMDRATAEVMARDTMRIHLDRPYGPGDMHYEQLVDLALRVDAEACEARAAGEAFDWGARYILGAEEILAGPIELERQQAESAASYEMLQEGFARARCMVEGEVPISMCP